MSVPGHDGCDVSAVISSNVPVSFTPSGKLPERIYVQYVCLVHYLFS